MGLFSGISKVLFGDPTKGIKRASADQLAFQQQGLDYLRDTNRRPLEIRDQGLGMLESFYGGGEGQNQIIEDVKSSPFYSQMIDTGQEGVLAGAGGRGMTRSGNVASDLNISNQNVLQNLVAQWLSGASRMAGVDGNTSSVANQFNQMGENVGGAGVAAANANQSSIGNMLGLVAGGIGAAGNLGWQPFKP